MHLETVQQNTSYQNLANDDVQDHLRIFTNRKIQRDILGELLNQLAELNVGPIQIKEKLQKRQQDYWKSTVAVSPLATYIL